MHEARSSWDLIRSTFSSPGSAFTGSQPTLKLITRCCAFGFQASSARSTASYRCVNEPVRPPFSKSSLLSPAVAATIGSASGATTSSAQAGLSASSQARWAMVRLTEKPWNVRSGAVSPFFVGVASMTATVTALAVWAVVLAAWPAINGFRAAFGAPPACFWNSFNSGSDTLSGSFGMLPAAVIVDPYDTPYAVVPAQSDRDRCLLPTKARAQWTPVWTLASRLDGFAAAQHQPPALRAPKAALKPLRAGHAAKTAMAGKGAVIDATPTKKGLTAPDRTFHGFSVSRTLAHL